MCVCVFRKGTSPRAVAYHIFNQTKCGNIYDIRFGSDTLRVQSEASAFTFNSLAQGSLHSPNVLRIPTSFNSTFGQ